jgi:NitT/TauT family transport system ATP-binding protein
MDAPMKAGTAPALLARFENVRKSFQQPAGASLEVVAGIELDIAAGDFITILGPSGCGKSTLLNMLAGIFAPTSGRVLYRGAPVNGLNLRTGYMTQNDHLLPWRTIASNVRAPLEINHVPRAAADRRVAELLEIAGLSAFARSYPSQVSGGMRKRAALARLLAYDPETLLLDEPFVALDAQLRLVMQAELRSLCRRLGKTALFVTHDVDEAAALGDRCIIFTARPGRIRKIVDIGLPRDRDVQRLRHDPRYAAISAALWEEMAREERAP